MTDDKKMKANPIYNNKSRELIEAYKNYFETQNANNSAISIAFAEAINEQYKGKEESFKKFIKDKSHLKEDSIKFMIQKLKDKLVEGRKAFYNIDSNEEGVKKLVLDANYNWTEAYDQTLATKLINLSQKKGITPEAVQKELNEKLNESVEGYGKIIGRNTPEEYEIKDYLKGLNDYRTEKKLSALSENDVSSVEDFRMEAQKTAEKLRELDLEEIVNK